MATAEQSADTQEAQLDKGLKSGALGLISTLWLGSVLVNRGSITLGELVLFNSYVLMLVGPLRIVGITLSQLQRALVSASLIGQLLERESDLTESSRP